MTSKVIFIGSLFAFALLVMALLTVGRPLLKQISVLDTTVSYLDMARQCSERRDYKNADLYYKQALMYAREHDATGQAESAMLLTYAKFAFEKKHDSKLANELQCRALSLKHKSDACLQPAANAAVR